MKPYYEGNGATIFCGDCREVLPHIGLVDATVVDPPYGISFMGKGWDRGVPGVEFWEAVAGAMKPGAHLLAFGGTRTFHRLTCAIEDAGFEIRDCLMWIYGSGFPKSLDVSKAIDKKAGAEREVVGKRVYGDGHIQHNTMRRTDADVYKLGKHKQAEGERKVTAPSTNAAKQWEGWGTALKPAWEPIILARKPLSEKTVAANVLKHGTGALNIDGCRVPGIDPANAKRLGKKYTDNKSTTFGQVKAAVVGGNVKGRWPANVVLSHHSECVQYGTKKVKGITGGNKPHKRKAPIGTFQEKANRPYFNYADADRVEIVEAWDCHPDCPMGMLPGTSASPQTYVRKADGKNQNVYSKGMGEATGKESVNFGDSGSAARFFYCAKTSKKERGEGNDHPTVKPIALMRYLCRLVTPPGGVVLDPFMGSGSTLVAAQSEHFRTVGIELEEKYCEIAAKRLGQEVFNFDG